MSTPDRPDSQAENQIDRNPLRKVAAAVTRVTGVITAVATTLVGFGIITAVQGDAVAGLLGAVPGLVGGIGALVAAFTTARQGEQHVTPLVDPRDDWGTPLVPDPSASAFPTS